MSSDEKVLDFPRVSPEENARRVTVEATRLASLAPGEWRLWIDRSPERLRIPRATPRGLIVAIIKDSEKKAREDKAEARRHEERVRREQEHKQRERKREQERIDKKANATASKRRKHSSARSVCQASSTRPESSNWPSVSMRTSLPFAMVSQRRWHGE